MAAHNNETYLCCWSSSADGGSDQGHGGDPGGGTAWTLDRVDGAKGGMASSITEVSHSSTDLPVRTQDYQFFASIPANAYGYFFSVGDQNSVGTDTSKTSTKNNPPQTTGTSSSATTSGYTLPSKPSIGNLVLVWLSVRSGVTASTPTDSSGEAYSLVFSGSTTGSVTNYLWKRVAQANDSAYVVTSALSGSAHWFLATTIIDTPSSTTVTKMDDRAFVNNGGNPLRMTLTAAAHAGPPDANTITGSTTSNTSVTIRLPKSAPRSFAVTAHATASSLFTATKPALAAVTAHVSAAVTVGVFKPVSAVVTASCSLVGSATRGFLIFANLIAHTTIDAKRRLKQKHPNRVWPPYDDPDFEFLGDKP